MWVYMYYISHWQGENTKIILILHVDNLLLLGEDQSEITDVKHQLGNLYHMKDLGPASSYLGVQITRDCKSRSIWIDQQAYIKNALKRFGLNDANNMKTPLPMAIHLEKYNGTATTENKTLFQQMIGTLIYAAIGTRPDIAFTATWLSWYNNNPLDSHIKYAKHVLRYLQGTKELLIKYDGSSNTELIGYSDSDWGSSLHIRTHLSDGKWMHFLGTTMAKDCCTFSGRSWIYGIIQHWKTSCLAQIHQQRDRVSHPWTIPLCVVNQAVIFLVVNPAVERWTKHINIWHHYIREQYEN